jgi:hypothetical protein
LLIAIYSLLIEFVPCSLSFSVLAIYRLQCVECGMSFFCMLCIPLVYLLRRSVFMGEGGGIRPLIFGCVVLAVQYFVGPVIEPGTFGLSRWMSGYIDIIGLPVLIPFMVCLLLVLFKIISIKVVDYAHFALLWLIPLAAFRAMGESSPPLPIPLVLVPVLWIVQTEGIAFLITCIAKKPRWYVSVSFVLGIIALPVAATTSWWAFFSHQIFYGFLFLFLCFIPAVLSVIIQYYSIGKGRTLSMLERSQSAMMSRSSPSATPENG